MQIQRLALKNFKCFKEVDVSFSKITLLTGENSSGKSSLIYGILVPLQSINANGKSFPLYLSLNGKYGNMGGFDEVLFKHDLNNNVVIDLNISHNESDIFNFETQWHFDTTSRSPDLVQLQIDSSVMPIVKLKQNEKLSYTVSIGENTLEINNLRLNNFSQRVYKSQISFYEYFVGLSEELTIWLNYQFNFISSLRLPPERTYYQSIGNNKVDKFGAGYIDQILDWTDRQSEELYELIPILKDLKILNDIKPHRIAGGRFEIQVKVKSRSKWESLADVGFGISQFLPIIVADLQLFDNSTLIMSQPEIHLHPSVQADLGNYLVKQVKERNKNYIVETHSEYLLNRIRLLIVNGEIQPEDVAVYYFENSIKNGSVAHRIEFTKQGQILNAPKGFFETYMIDTMDIALNA